LPGEGKKENSIDRRINVILNSQEKGRKRIA
jgi:hypothetical protein